jgi:SAM-dependent methyltransferase
MPSPWLQVPLADYEGHMSAPQVAQLAALADLFEQALIACQPQAVAVAGIAGGNGLDRVDLNVTRRVVGVDVCREYLDAAAQRYSHVPLELHCTDLANETLSLSPVDLAHAALVFEHAGVERALDNVLAIVRPGGRLSVVLQLASTLDSAAAAAVAPTGFDTIQYLAPNFHLIDRDGFCAELTGRGFHLVSETRSPVASGKALWMGLFERS